MRMRLEVGATFAVPLADGQFGAVFVVGVDAERDGGGAWFAATEYVGVQLPELDEPALKKIQILNTSGFSSAPRPFVWWQPGNEPPPSPMQFFGVISTIESQLKLAIVQSIDWRNTWERWAAIILHQWRWDNDREGLILGKYDNKPRPKPARRKRPEKSLVDLRRGPFFRSWDKVVPPRVKRAARRIARETIDELIELGSRLTKRNAIPILKKFIEGFNEMRTDIDTASREEILELFDEIVLAINVKGCEDIADEWREF